jgi:predicted extracellular nuclease
MLTLATFNLCNLGADAPRERLARLGKIIANELQGPDILAVQEVKALSQSDAEQSVPANAAYQGLIKAITGAGGPSYDFREIPPLVNQEGGHPRFNIRIGFLFNPQRIEFVDRGRAGPKDATGIRCLGGRLALTLSPGRIAPEHPAFQGDPDRHWAPSRRVLAGEFSTNDRSLFVIACHLKSMRATSQREKEYTKKQRHAQAEVVRGFVANLLVCDPQAHLVVLGDMNDLQGSKTLKILKGGTLKNLLDEVPKAHCYTRRHGGRPLTLDHILVSHSLQRNAVIRIPHVNSDSPMHEQVSDHDPVLATVVC